jgi:Glycosyltransferase family 87
MNKYSKYKTMVKSVDPEMLQQRLQKVFVVIIFIGFIAVAFTLVRGDKYQNDFKAYYYASEVVKLEGNPYDLTQVEAQIGYKHPYPFLYQPITLSFFKLFSSCSYHTAHIIWIGLKVICLIILVYLWKSKFLSEEPLWLFLLFVSIAFGFAVMQDLREGNISIIIQTLIWSGFYMIKRNRPVIFCILILLASVFRLFPIFLLFILPLLFGRRGWYYSIASALVMIAVQLLQYVVDPSLYGQWIQALQTFAERGTSANPSSYALIGDIADLGTRFGMAQSIVTVTSHIIYLMFISAVLIVSYKFIRQMKTQKNVDFAQILIFTSCLVYALIMPRFKTYSFIFLIPVAYYIIKYYSRGLAIAGFIVLLSLGDNPPIPSLIYDMFWWYYPFYIAVMLWVIWIRKNQPEMRLPETST